MGVQQPDEPHAECSDDTRAKRRERDRKRRDHLSTIVGVLDDVGGPGQIRPRTLAQVAAFYEVHPWVVTRTVRRHIQEFRADGWRPRHEGSPESDRWTDQAVVRAGLLIAESAVAAHLRHLLGISAMPLMYSTSRARSQQCRRLYEKALAVVADVHECSPDDLWRTMQTTDRYELMSLVVALAALTPYEQPGIGRWLQELGGDAGKDGCASKGLGLAMLVPLRQHHDERQLPQPGAAARCASVAR